MKTLVFIDTNIMLDFYRVRHKGAKLSLLNLIEKNIGKIITSEQVKMEYKKNRQKVILQSLKELKSPKWNTLTTPAFLGRNLTAQSIGKSPKEIEKKIKIIKKRMLNVLNNPKRDDPIYQTTQKLFKAKEPYNLSRDKKIRNRIRRLARKRWILGYPPRKKQDNSIGDAVNWEWIIECADQSGSNIVIVSRDSDYGHNLGKETILNDWLQQEFSQRISQKRKIYLTDRLTRGFEIASVKVSEKAKEDEKITMEESIYTIGEKLNYLPYLSEILKDIPDDFEWKLMDALRSRYPFGVKED